MIQKILGRIRAIIYPKVKYRGPRIRIYGWNRIKTNGKFNINTGSRIKCYKSARIFIGNNVTIGSYSRIISMNSIAVGDNTIIADFVAILDHNHTESKSLENWIGYSSKPIHIGTKCWLGDGVKVLSGVTLGNNVTVAANSVVTKSFESNVIIGGVPARILKYKLNDED